MVMLTRDVVAAEAGVEHFAAYVGAQTTNSTRHTLNSSTPALDSSDARPASILTSGVMQ